METQAQKNKSLPPRREFHKNKKQKKKFKLKYPIIRLLALFFILLPIAILSYTLKQQKEQPTEAKSSSNAAFESIDYESDTQIFPEEKIIENQKEKEIVKKDTLKEEVLNTTETTEVEKGVEVEEQLEEENNQTKEPQDIYEIKYHKVKVDETLFSISIKYYNSRDGEALLKKWNNLSDNTVYVGQTLKIPIKVAK